MLDYKNEHADKIYYVVESAEQLNYLLVYTHECNDKWKNESKVQILGVISVSIRRFNMLKVWLTSHVLVVDLI